MPVPIMADNGGNIPVLTEIGNDEEGDDCRRALEEHCVTSGDFTVVEEAMDEMNSSLPFSTVLVVSNIPCEVLLSSKAADDDSSF